jgi:hypothetical protein
VLGARARETLLVDRQRIDEAAAVFEREIEMET